MEKEKLYLESCILSQKIAENDNKGKELEKDQKVQEYIKYLERKKLLDKKAQAFADKFNSTTKKR